MNSKERVRIAISHREPDRIPVLYNGAEPELEEKIHAHYQVPDEYSLWLKLGIDFWPIDSDRYIESPEVIKQGKDQDSELQRADSVPEVETFFDQRREQIDYQSLYEDQNNLHTDKFRRVDGGSLFEEAWHRRGFEQLLQDFYLNPEIVEAVFACLLEKHYGRLENILRLFNSQPSEQNIDMVTFSDDLGTQQDLIFSPDMYRSFIKPRMRKLTNLAHKFGAVASLHSCGSVYNIIPELIDAGFDILNPIQISARNMEPKRLKQEFGKELTFWGGADTQTVFAHGSPESVRRQVKELKSVLGENGGYVCAPTHTLVEDIPLENAIAFFEAAFDG